MKLTIGLSGLARSGKDTFCALLVEELGKVGLNAKRFALADNLKAELRDFIRTSYNIDILTCSPEEKELVRDFLVFHGKMKRLKTQGKHWTTMLEQQILNDQTIDVAIVTDARYDVYPEDELSWIKNRMDGVLVHIKRFEKRSIDNVTCAIAASKFTDEEMERGYTRSYVQPPNSDEALNDPRLEAKADFKVDWDTGNFERYCRPSVQEFVKFLRTGAYIPV